MQLLGTRSYNAVSRCRKVPGHDASGVVPHGGTRPIPKSCMIDFERVGWGEGGVVWGSG